jgi:hypothetical protein
MCGFSEERTKGEATLRPVEHSSQRIRTPHRTDPMAEITDSRRPPDTISREFSCD